MENRLNFDKAPPAMQYGMLYSQTINLLKKPYFVLYCTFLIYFIFGFYLATPTEIIQGLGIIVTSPDILVTDYIEIAGLGATLINAGLVGVICVSLLIYCKHKPTGFTIMTIWLICGFSFFGKNPINIIPILIGGYLFSHFVREPFRKNILATLLATTLAPAVSQMWYLGLEPRWLGIALGIFIGIGIGFIIEPLAKNAIKTHEGYNLYNIGFAAGILALIIMSIFRNIGIDFSPVNIWSGGNNKVVLAFLLCHAVFLLFVGFVCMDKKKGIMRSLVKMPASSKDYFQELKEICYLNMGLLIIFTVLFLLIIDAELTGPVIGGIFTIVGFGCCGKKITNITPVMIGATIGGIISQQPLNSSNVVICILFSTCLSPLADQFGFFWGMVAGFLHLNAALNTGLVHGGLNLYNNGLAGGFVIMILVPIIRAIKRKDLPEAK